MQAAIVDDARPAAGDAARHARRSPRAASASPTTPPIRPRPRSTPSRPRWRWRPARPARHHRPARPVAAGRARRGAGRRRPRRSTATPQPNPVIPSVPADLVERRHLGRGRAQAGLRPAARAGGAERRRRCSATSTRWSPTSASARRPENLGALLADLRTMLDSSGIKQAPAELSALLASARGIVDQAVQAKLVDGGRRRCSRPPAAPSPASTAPPKDVPAAGRRDRGASRRQVRRCRSTQLVALRHPRSSATSTASCSSPEVDAACRPRSTPRSPSCAR